MLRAHACVRLGRWVRGSSARISWLVTLDRRSDTLKTATAIVWPLPAMLGNTRRCFLSHLSPTALLSAIDGALLALDGDVLVSDGLMYQLPAESAEDMLDTSELACTVRPALLNAFLVGGER